MSEKKTEIESNNQPEVDAPEPQESLLKQPATTSAPVFKRVDQRKQQKRKL